MLEPFTLPFFQRGIAEVLLLALACGLLGTWIVLRGLAFFTHAVGTATFPGLVLADGLGFSAALGAFGAALVMAGLVGLLARRRGTAQDSATALVLAAALALGILLASDVFGSQARVDRLLFGSLLLIDAADLRLAALAALAVVLAVVVLGPRWLEAGFAGASPQRRARATDAALILLVALVAVAALAAVGALLATALLVVPAVTARLFTDRMPAWQLASLGLAAFEGVAGMWLAFQLDVPPGAAIAVLGGVVFAAVAALGALRRPGVAGPRSALAAALVVIAAPIAVVGCRTTGGTAGGRPVVVATTTQLTDIARRLGGSVVDVRGILRANSDPHEYEPRPSDVQAVSGARLILLSGLGLDDWGRQVVADAGGDAAVLDVGAAATGRALPGPRDPHWWQDPLSVIGATRGVERALIAAAPAGRAELQALADSYRARLRAADRAIRACILSVPARERRIVTDHDAFGRFAARYGITVVGAVIPSATTRSQASAGALAALERTIRRERVRAVFPEAAVNGRLAQRIARDTGASAANTLYGDSLGPAGSGAASYLGMLAANTRALVRGMSGGSLNCEIAP